jgi:hypothetical protein
MPLSRAKGSTSMRLVPTCDVWGRSRVSVQRHNGFRYNLPFYRSVNLTFSVPVSVSIDATCLRMARMLF